MDDFLNRELLNELYITHERTVYTASDIYVRNDTVASALELTNQRRRLDYIEQRLCILEEDKKMQMQYPSLQEAWDHYQKSYEAYTIMKKLLGGK